jgi:hypothetical protein
VATAEPKTKLDFSRFEFKFVLPTAMMREVEAELSHFVELDPFVVDRPDFRYPVRSLYFDDAAHTAFHDKIDGLHSRAKFRLRTYTVSLSDPAPVFLEIKGRFNNLVFKHRTPMDTDGLDLELGGEGLRREVSARTDGVVHDKFEFDLYRKQILPVALIDYVRRPYLSKFDPEFRLTVDEEVRATHTHALFPGHGAPSPRRIVPGQAIMEVKFRYHMPLWFHRIIQAYQLRRRSISKICEGMQVLELAVDPG